MPDAASTVPIIDEWPNVDSIWERTNQSDTVNLDQNYRTEYGEESDDKSILSETASSHLSEEFIRKQYEFRFKSNKAQIKIIDSRAQVNRLAKGDGLMSFLQVKGGADHLIRSEGYKIEGIFRVMNDLDRVNTLMTTIMSPSNYDNNTFTCIIDWTSVHPYDIAGVIKAYGRLRMGGLLNPHHIDTLLSTKDGYSFIKKLEADNLLEQAAYCHLIRYVALVVDEAKDITLMGYKNLARVFAPNLYQPENIKYEMHMIRQTIDATEVLLHSQCWF